MSADARATLKDQLGADLPVLDELTDADAEALLALVERARREQAAALTAAEANTLRHVPALLRGAVKKLLFR